MMEAGSQKLPENNWKQYWTLEQLKKWYNDKTPYKLAGGFTKFLAILLNKLPTSNGFIIIVFGVVTTLILLITSLFRYKADTNTLEKRKNSNDDVITLYNKEYEKTDTMFKGVGSNTLDASNKIILGFIKNQLSSLENECQKQRQSEKILFKKFEASSEKKRQHMKMFDFSSTTLLVLKTLIESLIKGISVLETIYKSNKVAFDVFWYITVVAVAILELCYIFAERDANIFSKKYKATSGIKGITSDFSSIRSQLDFFQKIPNEKKDQGLPKISTLLIDSSGMKKINKKAKSKEETEESDKKEFPSF